MKKILAAILVIALLLPMVFSFGTVAGAAEFTEKPYYGLGWSDINRLKFPNLEGMTIVSFKDLGGGKLGMTYAGKTDPKEIAAAVKKTIDRLPEGMRHILLAGTAQAFYLAPEDAVFFDEGVGQMKALFTEFIEEYKAIGGLLDGIALDTEYVWMSSWYVYSKFYGPLYTPTVPSLYKDIVENPKYETEIRPLLVERGFKFYETPNGNKSEISSAFPYRYLSTFLGTKDISKYSTCESIWNTVMDIHLANYLNDALYEPMIKCYPNALMSDYQEDNTAAWLKSLSDTGGIRSAYGGNEIAIGNASNYNTYASRPSSSFYKDSNGNYLYPNLPAYNKANYEDDPYNMFLYDANKFKQMYAATDNKRITAWIAEYDYATRAGSVANTPYYSETILHIGLLNPEAFLLYIYEGSSKFKGTNGMAEWNKRMQVVSELMYELTRVAGFSDRKPIETPANWNDGFVLSGMYAGGRNIWRLTPDITDGTTLESFKVKDDVPTFTINGSTITFPQGRIIADNPVSVVGTCGYWIETPKDVHPVITRSANRYSEHPSYMENFNGYAAGTSFEAETLALPQTWEVTKSTNLLIENGALALLGTANLKNVKLPQNITAGDSYAKQQAWEVSFTLPQAVNFSAEVELLTCDGNDGIKLQGSEIYYYDGSSYQQLGVTINPGQKYTVKRELDFRTENAYTSSYYVYSDGKLLKKVENVAMRTISLPVSSIGISCSGLTKKVLIDDYKLYPTGLASDFEVYNGVNGLKLNATEQADAAKVAYRLSWLNATSESVKMNIRVARYDNAGALASDTVLRTIEMAPGADCVETGIVENTTGQIKVYLQICEHTDVRLQGIIEPSCNKTGYTGDRVCKDCGEVLELGTAVPAINHTEEIIPGKAESCAATGLTEGKKCSVCGEILQAQETVPTLNHTEEIIPGKAATCSATGLTDGKKCSVCGEILQAQETVPTLNHTEEIIPGKAATCTATGLTDGKKCSVCGEILQVQEIAPALSHTEEIIPGKAATSTETGLTDGVKCFVCGEILKEQEVIAVVVPTTAPTTEPTTVPTTAPTTAPTTVPTTAPTTAPTTVPTTAPTTAPTTVPTTAPTTAPTAAPTTTPTDPTEPVENDSGSFAIWIAVAVVVLAVAGVGVWFFTKKKA